MGHVTGPISTLPGALHTVPARQCCDKHADRLAVKRVQGETDSMGSELIDMCAECYADYVEYSTSPEAADARCGTCDWCSNSATDLRHRRDFEEGLSGRVYMVCGACVDKETQAVMAEIHADDRDSDWGEDPWSDDRDFDFDNEVRDYEDEVVNDVDELAETESYGITVDPWSDDNIET